MKLIKYFLFLSIYSTIIFLVVYILKPVPVLHDYKSTDYYRNTLESVKNSKEETYNGNIKIGWSEANITPDNPQQIIGFGLQPNYESVQDSVYVRTFVFTEDQNIIAYLSFDFLLSHPNLVKAVKKACKQKGLGINHFYFTATHSHNSYGAFDDSFAGSLLLGKKDDEVLNFIAEKAALSIKESIKNARACEVAFLDFEVPELVHNRLSGEGKVDDKIRGLVFKDETDKQAVLFTYAAHAASLAAHVHDNILSADYPGLTKRQLENNPNINFASYSAGGVGSHNPVMEKNNLVSMESFSKTLAGKISNQLNNVNFRPIKNLSFKTIPIYLNSACLRLNDKICVGQKGFNLLFGRPDPSLDFLEINDYTMVSTPCDFSGELILDLESKLPNKDFIITSFNGSYIGYITPDHYYLTNHHREQYALNWFGYGNGSYFKEILEYGLEKK